MSAIKDAFHDKITAAMDRFRERRAAHAAQPIQGATYDALFGPGAYSWDVKGQTREEYGYQLEHAKIRQDARWDEDMAEDRGTECNHFFPDTGMRVSYCNHCGQKATLNKGNWVTL